MQLDQCEWPADIDEGRCGWMFRGLAPLVPFMKVPPRTVSILHVSQPVDGGVARCVADLAGDQVRRGWDVTVASPSAGRLPGWVHNAGAGHVHWAARREPGLSVFAEATALQRVAQRVGPLIVHLHSAKAGLAGRLAIRRRRPTIFQPHAWSVEAAEGRSRGVAAAWERWAARWTDVIVCVSTAEMRRGVDIGVPGLWQVVRNGVDLQAHRPYSDAEKNAARRRLALGDDPLVVCIARLSKQKGQDVLLDAWPRVLRQIPEARLVLVGEGPDRSALGLRAGPRVVFAGEREDVGEWFGAADVIAMPSRWEGMSLVMLEAMARGKSIVASDVAGASEALSGLGAIVPVEDPPSLARAIIQRLEDRALREAEGSAARERAESWYDLSRATAQIAAIYTKVLERVPLQGDAFHEI